MKTFDFRFEVNNVFKAINFNPVFNPSSSATQFQTNSIYQDISQSYDPGGRLGQIVPGETTPEFEAALIALRPGEICAEPVRTRYGVHVLRLDQRVEGRQLPFEQARARIATYLEERSWRRAVAQYITLLAGQARIEGFDLPGASTPLVQ